MMILKFDELMKTFNKKRRKYNLKEIQESFIDFLIYEIGRLMKKCNDEDYLVKMDIPHCMQKSESETSIDELITQLKNSFIAENLIQQTSTKKEKDNMPFLLEEIIFKKTNNLVSESKMNDIKTVAFKALPYSVLLYYSKKQSSKEIEKFLESYTLSKYKLFDQKKSNTEDNTWKEMKFLKRKEYRKGPEKIKFCKKDLSELLLFDEGLSIMSKSDFSSIIGNVGVTNGRWYYECVILTDGLKQIGWATPKFTPTVGNGCGDDNYSWGYDGYRNRVWHKKLPNGNKSYGIKKWAKFDIVGCALDLIGRTMHFYLNGTYLGEAFRDIDGSDGIYPAASIANKEFIKFVFSPFEFKYPPPNGYYPLVGDGPANNSFKSPFKQKARHIINLLEVDGVAVIHQGTYGECVYISKEITKFKEITNKAIVTKTEYLSIINSILVGNFDFVFSVKQSSSNCVLFNGDTISHLVSELIAFLRNIINSPVKNEVENSIQRFLDKNPQTNNKDEKRKYNTFLLGLIYLIGGFVEPKRKGCFVTTKDINSQKGEIVHVDEKNMAKVLFPTTLKNTDKTNNIINKIKNKNYSLLSIHIDSLIPVPEIDLNLHSFKPEISEKILSKLTSLSCLINDYTKHSIININQDLLLKKQKACLDYYNKYLIIIHRAKKILKLMNYIRKMSLSLILSGKRNIIDIKKYMDLKVRLVITDIILMIILIGVSSMKDLFNNDNNIGAKIRNQIYTDLLLNYNNIYIEEVEKSIIKFTKELFISLKKYEFHDNYYLFEVISKIGKFNDDTQIKMVQHHHFINQNKNLNDELKEVFDRNKVSNGYQELNCSFKEIALRTIIAIGYLLDNTPNLSQTLISSPRNLKDSLNNMITFSNKMLSPYIDIDDTKAQLISMSSRFYDIANHNNFLQIDTPYTYSNEIESSKKLDISLDKLNMNFSENDENGNKYSARPNRMLKYWEKHIIPRIKNYVKGSFRQYEMEYFFEQLRQPLRAGNMNKAIEVANTLTAGRIPEGIKFPKANTDWSIIMYDEVKLGDKLTVVQDKDTESENGIVSLKVGCVKEFDSENEKLLLAIYVESEASLIEKWYRIHHLKFAKEKYDYNKSSKNIKYLEDIELSYLNALTNCAIASSRKTIISLFSRNLINLSEKLIITDHKKIINSIFNSILSDIELINMQSLGLPISKKNNNVKNLENQLFNYLNICNISNIEKVDFFVNKFHEMININIQWMKKSFFSSVKEFNNKNDNYLKLRVVNSVGLMIIFTKDSYIEKGENYINIYSDIMNKTIFKKISGGSDRLSTLKSFIYPGDTCWVNLTTDSLNSSLIHFELCVIPIHFNFGLMFWHVRFLLNYVIKWVKDKKSFCYKLMEYVLRDKDIAEMSLSPIKEQFLKLISIILSKIISLYNEKTNHKDIKNKNLSLDKLKFLKEELKNILNNKVEEIYSSYTQQVIELNVISDCLRSEKNRICSNYNTSILIKPNYSKEKPDEDNKWSCGMCTFLNEKSNSFCQICGGEKVINKKSETKNPTLTEEKLLHNMLFLVSIIEYITKKNTFLENKTAFRTIIESCMREQKEDNKNYDRFVCVKNIPYAMKGKPDFQNNEIKEKLSSLFSAAFQKIKIEKDQITIIEDKSKEIKKNVDQRKNPYKKDSLIKFIPLDKSKKNLSEYDKKGIIYYLGTLGGKLTYKNPYHRGKVNVSSSSLHKSSQPIHKILGLNSIRCLTEPKQNSWIVIDFKNNKINPSAYAIRHYSSWNTEALRSWNFEGSNDGINWVCLISHNRDNTINKKGEIYMFHLEKLDLFFNKFRIYMTNKNSNNHYYLTIGGFEIYGVLEDSERIMDINVQTTNKYAIVEIPTNNYELRDSFIKSLNSIDFEMSDRSFSKLEITNLTDPTVLNLFIKSKLLLPGGVINSNFHNAITKISYQLNESKEYYKDQFSIFSKKCSKQIDIHNDQTILLERIQTLEFFKESSKDIKKEYFTNLIYNSFNNKMGKMILEKKKNKNVLLQSVKSINQCNLFNISNDYNLDNLFYDFFAKEIDTSKNSTYITLSEILELFNSLSSTSDELLEKIITLATTYCKGENIDQKHFFSILSHVTKLNPKIIYEWLIDFGLDSNLNITSDSNIFTAINIQDELNKHFYKNRKDFMELMDSLSDLYFEKSPISLKANQINLAAIKKLDFQYPKLLNFNKISINSLRIRFLIIKKLNELLEELLPFINLKKSKDPYSLAGIICSCKKFMFKKSKLSFMETIMKDTAEKNIKRVPVININIFHILKQRENKSNISFENDTHFGIAAKQLTKINNCLLRPPRPQGTEPFLAFEINFIGQHVEGTAGPYRQFFSEIGTELMDTYSLLFLTSPKSKNFNVNDFDDELFESYKGNVTESSASKFIINPSSISSTNLHFYEILGILFGSCIRTGVNIGLELSPFVWKALVFEKLKETDLKYIDPLTYHSLMFIKNNEIKSFRSNFNQTFTTCLSDGTSVELKYNGEKIKVTEDNKIEYVNLVFKLRLEEQDKQIKAIHKGMEKIFPIHVLKLFTWPELKFLICGNANIDIALLKRHTEYSKGIDKNAKYIQHFWDMLTDFKQEYKKKFIKFVWAHDCIPYNDEEFERTRTRLLISPYSKKYTNEDILLPKAHTCFFNLELPKYSTREIMDKKFILAITQTVTMNADEDNELSENMDNYNSDIE